MRKDHEGRMGLDVAAYYERYGPAVYRRCLRLLKNEDQALDAMQDVFARLVVHADGLKHDRPFGLLFRMAAQVSLNMIRSRRRSGVVAVEEDWLDQVAACEDPARRSWAGRLLEKVFHREKPDTRTMAVMHWLDGMTHEEVARETGLSVSGVRKRLRLLREKAHKVAERDHGIR